MRPGTALLLAALLAASGRPAGATESRDPHALAFEEKGCAYCHLAVPGQGRALQRTVFRKSMDDLCQTCHAASLEDNLNHRVGIRPSMKVPPDLHLSDRGELSCITCHDPHGEYVSSTTGARTWYLRRQMLKRELCLACHADESFEEPHTAVTLLAPANNAVVDALPVPLIGTLSEGGVAEVAVEINDARLVLSVEHGAFSTMLKLREGINTVRISGNGVSPEVVNILFSPTLPREMTYRLYRAHGMANRKDCFVCHEREARSFAIGGRDAALCGKCHAPRPPARFLHGPVAVGSCTVCHDPHGQTNRAFLVATGESLCFRCHTEAEVLKHLVAGAGSIEGFAREKGCTACHDPHQADRRYLLREKS